MIKLVEIIEIKSASRVNPQQIRELIYKIIDRLIHLKNEEYSKKFFEIRGKYLKKSSEELSVDLLSSKEAKLYYEELLELYTKIKNLTH